MVCAFSINYAATSGRTDHPRYGPALEIVDRPSTKLARFRRTETVSQAWTFQTLNESTQASRANRRAPPVIDLRPEVHPVNWFESFKLLKADLAMHAVRIVYARKKNMSICQICYYTTVEIDYPFGAQERLLICAAAQRRLQGDHEVEHPRRLASRKVSSPAPRTDSSLLQTPHNGVRCTSF